MNSKVAFTLLVLLIVPALSIAQSNSTSELLLFEKVETPESNNRGERPVRPRNNDDSNSGTPDFTLLGISRIGDQQSAILKHSSGNTVRVRLDSRENTNVQVPGYLNFSIVDFTSDEISLRLPESSSCTDSALLGVKCSSAGNIALLSLANGEPVPSSIESTATDGSADGARVAEDTANNGEPVNPFAAIRAQRNAADNSTQATSTGRFTPRRIAPEDVPPGMRVVSTPFGDRLVEQ